MADNEPVILEETTSEPVVEAPVEAAPETPPTRGSALKTIANVLMEVADALDKMDEEHATLKQELEDEKSGRAGDAEAHAKKLADAEAIAEEQIRMLKKDIERALTE